VITATDSGAVLEVTENEKNGLVVEPAAREIARALDLLVSDVRIHKQLSQGHRRSHRKLLNIEKLVESLVE
jgi:glycosyltransferase involved in cell wall biosynthesis